MQDRPWEVMAGSGSQLDVPSILGRQETFEKDSDIVPTVQLMEAPFPTHSETTR